MEGQTNGLCIAGFIVSLGSLFLGLFGITGLVGTVCRRSFESRQ